MSQENLELVRRVLEAFPRHYELLRRGDRPSPDCPISLWERGSAEAGGSLSGLGCARVCGDVRGYGHWNARSA